MPTTLPSPVDGGEFRFVAVDASGAVWRWVDEDMVWVREPQGLSSDVDDADRPLINAALSVRMRSVGARGARDRDGSP